jgi:hypothetical protein
MRAAVANTRVLRSMYATACSPRANTIARAGRAGTSSTTLSGCSLLRGATRDVRARAFGGLFGKAKGGVAKEPQVRLEAYEGDDEPGDWPFQVCTLPPTSLRGATPEAGPR